MTGISSGVINAKLGELYNKNKGTEAKEMWQEKSIKSTKKVFSVFKKLFYNYIVYKNIKVKGGMRCLLE
ncbi:hypothetical protein ES703_03033 [subsurface metagenome]